MATPLLTSLTRESSQIIDGRNIIITLSEAQEILIKLKGLKSGVVSIPIADLYHQLNGSSRPAKKGSVSVNKNQATADEPMISLSRLRSLNMTTPGKIELVSRLDELIKEYADLVKKEISNNDMLVIMDSDDVITK